MSKKVIKVSPYSYPGIKLSQKDREEFRNSQRSLRYRMSKDEILQIIELELSKTIKRGTELGFNLQVTEALKSHLIEVGYDPQYGARPLKRALQKWIDDYVTEFIIEKSPKEGSTLIIDYDKEGDKSVVSEPTEGKKSSKKKPKDD